MSYAVTLCPTDTSRIQVIYVSNNVCIVRPVLEYGSALSYPYAETECTEFERVPRNFLRFASFVLKTPYPFRDYGHNTGIFIPFLSSYLVRLTLLRWSPQSHLPSSKLLDA